MIAHYGSAAGRHERFAVASRRRAAPARSKVPAVPPLSRCVSASDPRGAGVCRLRYRRRPVRRRPSHIASGHLSRFFTVESREIVISLNGMEYFSGMWFALLPGPSFRIERFWRKDPMKFTTLLGPIAKSSLSLAVVLAISLVIALPASAGVAAGWTRTRPLVTAWSTTAAARGLMAIPSTTRVSNQVPNPNSPSWSTGSCPGSAMPASPTSYRRTFGRTASRP